MEDKIPPQGKALLGCFTPLHGFSAEQNLWCAVYTRSVRDLFFPIPLFMKRMKRIEENPKLDQTTKRASLAKVEELILAALGAREFFVTDQWKQRLSFIEIDHDQEGAIAKRIHEALSVMPFGYSDGQCTRFDLPEWESYPRFWKGGHRKDRPDFDSSETVFCDFNRPPFVGDVKGA